MPHSLVHQLRFTRSEFQRAINGVTDLEARQRFLPMNCLTIRQMLGHSNLPEFVGNIDDEAPYQPA